MHLLGVSAIEKQAQKIAQHFMPEQPAVPSGKRLVGVLTYGSRKIGVDLTESSEYETYFLTYYLGRWDECGLYLLDEALLPKCLDE